ncbi:MAG: PqqD family protein [Dysgonamonadaceae bacterium]|jgi:hypothetical protein|nr:PqqD family protein [Dysgonamonadaceae bacterium]
MKLKKSAVLKDIAGEKVVIIQGKTGVDMTKIISFNPVAAWLWSEFFGDTDFSEADVAQKIVRQYGLEQSRAEEDAAKWLAQLKDAKLIEE